MKKIIIGLILLGFFTSCEQSNVSVSKKQVPQSDKASVTLAKIQALCDEYSNDSVKVVGTRTSEQDEDWEAILTMDGLGAFCGFRAAIESFFFEAAVPAAVIAAVAFSVAEYERQQADSTSNNYYPAIDPLNPIKNGWQYDVIAINHTAATMGSAVGNYHNTILEEIVANSIPLNTSSSGANLYTISQIYGYMVDNTYVTNAYNILSQYNLNGFNVNEYLDSVELTFLTYYNNTAPFLTDSARASFTYQIVDMIINSSLDHEDEIILAIMTTYYSSFIWNRMI